ncbi:translation initiation factor IF-2-like [Anoplopoma fimbria]|uniref:translation initiation factor IF-2-like n=1 Tax=Anoplopoma fimbria TaxID=229290 RepID=UPI0023EC505F|nr:translation initiation factor IF-2-like [Anoplopoma fimbria]
MEQTATDPDQKKSLAADDKQEEAEHCEEPVAPTPVRGRRGKKTEATAPPAVRQTPRGRKAKSQESPSDDQPEMAPEKAVETTLVTEISTEAVSDQTSPINENDSTPAEEEAVVKPTRGRKTRKTPVEPTEDVSDESPETSIPALEKPKRGRKPKPDAVEQNEVVEDTVVAVETKQQSQPPVRAKRGRNAKQEEEKPESTSVETTKSQEPAKKVRKTRKAEQASEDQPEMIQEVVTEAEMVPEPESQQSALVDVDHEASDSAAPLEKAVVKPKRGRKVKQPEPSVAEQQDVPSSHSEDVPQADMTEEAPVRGRRGKKTEATAPPAVRQKTRGRNTKSQESPSDDQPEMAPEKAVETTLVTETSTMKENESAPAEEEAVVKPTRGRKSKQTPVEPPQPEQSEDVSDESLPADAQPQKSIPALEKPKRGRKLKPDAVEQNEVVEVVAQPPVRAKRGRNAKQEEEKPESTSVETTKSQEPAKKIRKTRKAEQALVEAGEEVQSIEMVVPEEAEAPLVAEPVKMKEPATVAAKPKRAGRKATEVQEVPAASSTDKLKRGTRGKRVTEEGGVESVVPEEKPEHEVDAEQGNNAEPDAPVIKQSRARGAKTSVKNEVSQAIPAKKARRGAALPLEETNAESTVLVSEPASSSVKPAKRGRRAADDAPVTSEVSSKAVVEDTKTSKRAVKWKADCEVFEVPEATPVKAVRGKKSKIGSKVDTESKNVPKDAGKTEEKDLSDKVGEAQPVKKTRRGAKVADVTADEAESTSEADAQPKTRRGRTSKK